MTALQFNILLNPHIYMKNLPAGTHTSGGKVTSCIWYDRTC